MSDAAIEKKLEIITTRALKILDSGERPQWIFVAQLNGGLVLRNRPDDKVTTIPLFSSPPQALDYLRTLGGNGQLGGIKLADLPAATETWIARGVDTFSLNPCPRCRVTVETAIEELRSLDSFLKSWALTMATREWKGAELVQEAFHRMEASAFAEARMLLEQLRDHVACDIPEVHLMIGLVAEMQGDASAKQSALQRLEEFGPEFAGKTEFTPELMARTNVGLLAAFGLLKTE